MCLSATLIISLLLFTKTSSDAETRESSLNIAESPASVDFHDIFSSHLAMLSDDKIQTQVKDKDFHLQTSPLVEFRFPKVDTTTGTPLSTPPAKYAISAAHVKKPNATANDATNSSSVPNYISTPSYSSTVPSSMEVTDDSTVIVAPMKDNHQRGVLDLLFPSSRVKMFKNVFDSLKMILSNTFRRR
ncbi:unnamed protein product [Chilo suppressalis]|uniref:Uncharacterized protein n=1 Tax=Chilo suppressalis TaxID=168631 RepID=A0ABN8AP41_CHISP|nr:unnamed protein product [Chilo suppressalis]